MSSNPNGYPAGGAHLRHLIGLAEVTIHSIGEPVVRDMSISSVSPAELAAAPRVYLLGGQRGPIYLCRCPGCLEKLLHHLRPESAGARPMSVDRRVDPAIGPLQLGSCLCISELVGHACDGQRTCFYSRGTF